MRSPRHPLVFALLLLAAQPAVARDDEKVTKKQAAEKIADFEKYYANRNEHVRKAAVDDLGLCDHQDVVPHLLEALKDKSELVRASVSPALAKQTTAPSLHLLNRELDRSRNLETQLAILQAFKTTRPKVAYGTVLGLAANDVFELRLVAAELLALLPSEKGQSEKLLVELTSDSTPQIRLVAIDALTALQHPEAVDLCLRMMKEDADWRVQASCIAAVARFRLKRTVEPLMEMMEHGEGRLADDAHQALQELTGEDYPNKPATWQKWWKRVKDRFEVPTVADLRAAREKLRLARAAYGRANKDDTPYHGINTKSKRMLFVLDISGSMNDKLVFETSDERRLAEFRERYGDYETKIDLAREELINTVARLEPHVRFNIITFNADVKLWKPKPVSASPGNRTAAIKFLSKLTPDYINRVTIKEDKGETNSFGALNAALGLKDDPNDKPSKTHTVESDTVFFLTDGMPTIGRITQPDELLRYVLTVNRRAKIVFHTITFGHANEALLEPMARESGGQFVVISVD